MKPICDHCLSSLSMPYNGNGIVWCRCCAEEETELLSSLDLTYYSPTYCCGTDYASWGLGDNVNKLTGIPTINKEIEQ